MERRFFDYRIIYSRRRSIAIHVGADSGVVVRSPYHIPQKKIEEFVFSKSAWILKHLEKHSTITRISNIKYADGETILFRGNSYIFRLIPSEKNKIEIFNNTVQAYIKTPADSLKVKMIMDKWFRDKAEEEFLIKLNDILVRFNRYSFSPAGFAVKSMKRRWGSCTAKGKITLNTELIKLDDRFTEYVIMHELCHLVHHNHGTEYYKLLSEVFPAWKPVRKELRQYLG